MWLSAIFSLLLFSLLPIVISERPDGLWTTPNGTDYNFADIIYNGEYYPLAWPGWSPRWVNSRLKGVQINDLWVATYHYKEVEIPYAQLIRG